MSVQFSREMTLRRDEFLRELPQAIDHRPHHLEGNRVIVEDGSRRVTIDIIDQGQRELGALELPLERLDFSFEGYDEAEVDNFMARFDAHTLRFGGM